VVENPSFLVLDEGGDHLYAVTEVETFEGRHTGLVNAFAVDRVTGALTFLNRQVSEGASPCHLSLAAGGRYLLVANYHGGTIASLPVRADGGLDPAVCVVQHEGAGVHPERQEAAHAHSVHFDPASGLVFALDLGLDQIRIYELDAASGRLKANAPAHVATPPGAGPRHLAFDPSGPRVYVTNELTSSVTVYRLDRGGRRLTPVETASTLPAGFTGENTTAEVQCLASGAFVYVSNRGHDSIAIFGGGGSLTPAGHVPTLGKTPRHFAIDPSDAYLLAANQGSDEVVVFSIDPATGGLQPAGSSVRVSRPVCVVFAR
jgi:6-phosphogluconolactonase